MWTDKDKIKGKILFFSPNEEGTSYFTDSLIYICDHNEQGSLGLIFNRPLELDLKELLRGLKISEVDNAKGNVFLGGPVNPGAIFILHSSDKYWKGTLKVSEHVYMSTDFEAIEDIAKGDGPKNWPSDVSQIQENKISLTPVEPDLFWRGSLEVLPKFNTSFINAP